MFNNREWAYILIGLVFLIWVLRRKNTRVGMSRIWKAFFRQEILTVLLAIFLYASLEIWAFYKIRLWNPGLIKETGVWLLGTIFIFVRDIEGISKDKRYFEKRLIENFRFIIAVEFLIGLYTFNLWCELILALIILFLTGLATIAEAKAETNSEYKAVKKSADCTLGFCGLVLISWVVYKALSSFRSFATLDNLRAFIVPPGLTLLFLPFMYVLSLYIIYEGFFNAIYKKDKALFRYAKWKAIRLCHVDRKKLIHLSLNSRRRLARAKDKEDVRKALGEYQGGIPMVSYIKRYVSWVIATIVIIATIGYLAIQKPPFDDVMEVIRAFGELYAWPLVILILAGIIFREPVKNMLARIRSFSTSTFSVDFSADTEFALTIEGKLNINRPGNIFWLAHNLEHTMFRLDSLWSKEKVLAMLDRSICHAKRAEVPNELLAQLTTLRDKLNNSPPSEALWRASQQELIKVFGAIAKVAENSHPADDQYHHCAPDS